MEFDVDQLLSLTGLDVPYPETLPVPSRETTVIGDIFQTGGLYRVLADLMASQATWYYRKPFPMFWMGKRKRGMRLSWNLRLRK